MFRLTRVGFGLVVAAVALVAPAATTAAHSALIRSDPTDGQILDTAPAEVVLEFSEAPDPGLSKVAVYDRDGEQIDHGELEIEPSDARIVMVMLPDLDEGVFTVSWQALSSVDGHVTTGAFSFGIGLDPAEEEMAAPTQQLGEDPNEGRVPAVAGRWMLYVALALVFAWALLGLVIFRGQALGPSWVPAVCWVVAAAGLAWMTAAEAASVGASISELLSSSAGERLVRTGVVLVVLGLMIGLALRWRRIVALLATTGVASVAMYTHVAAGHAGAPGDFTWANLGLQWLHFSAIGAWIGGLVWLLMGSRGPDPEQRQPSLVGRFSTLATVCLAVVVVTGTIRAIVEIRVLDELWNSDYGRTFLIKLAIIVPLVALGATNRFWNVPALLRGEGHRRRLRHTVRGEVTFAAVVLAVTGILATTAPPDEHAEGEEAGMGGHATEEGGIVVTEGDFATTVNVTLEITPGTIGENVFTVSLADYDTGEPVEAMRVALRFTIPDQPEFGPSMLELMPGDEHGTWMATGTNVAQPARWEATAIITYSDDGVEVPLEFEVTP
jgi:copper transport protein